jgi:hypothetical protein
VEELSDALTDHLREALKDGLPIALGPAQRH